MSTDSADINISNSHSHLIEVHHVGVTAKLQSPFKKLMPRLSCSTDSEMYPPPNSHSQYRVFQNEVRNGSTETTIVSSTGTPSVLYQMHTEPEKQSIETKPQRIEFQRYSKKRPHLIIPTRKSRTNVKKGCQAQKSKPQKGFFARLVASLDNMCKCQPQHTRNIIDDLPEPHWNKKESVRHTCIGIYPFEHGCADYLSTTDTHPKINSIVLADRATTYATHFWAELFGLLHIAVAFVVAFILQSYRFLLYSVVNSLLVGLLHMSSDYLVKPILTVFFNGYIQPPLIFVYNIFCSLRDILEPVAETLNNFMKPLATVGSSLRLVNVNYREARKLSKDV